MKDLIRRCCALACTLFVSCNVIAQPPVTLALTPEFRLVSPDTPPRPTAPGWKGKPTRCDEFDAVEWQWHVQSEPSGTPLKLDGANSADVHIELPAQTPVTLHWSRGSHSETADFEPMTQVIAAGAPISLESFGGRSSDGTMPYFNLEGEGGGAILAIGWTGDWRASFTLDDAGKVHFVAGLKDANFTVPAGETLRLPSILMMAYQGNWFDGQNKFRRLMLKHYTPATQPPMKLMPVAASVHGMIGFNDTTEENLTKLAADIAATKLPLDTYWLDAGWNTGGFAAGQGNPDADATRFPHGLTTVGEAVHATGLRFLTWFEPERAMRGTWLFQERRQWLLTPSNTPAELRYQENDGFRLLDLGNADARAWAVEKVSKYIDSAKLEYYRQDFNLYPSYFWHTDEPANEKGLREVRYINGLYAYLDALHERFPNLILDNCASGGRRLDFEMMKRTVPLWRSDSCWDSKDFPRNVQAMAYGLSLWFPLHGLGAASTDTVALRSGMGACASFAINYRDPATVEALRAHLEKYLPIRELFSKDFYPLTPWSTDPKEWLAFQYHDPVTNHGVVLVIRGDTSDGGGFQVRPYGLNVATQYSLSNWDAASMETRSGGNIKAKGIMLKPTRNNDVVVLEYKPVT